MTKKEKAPDTVGALEHSSQFTQFLAEVSGQIIWDYREEKSKVNNLYEIAKAKAWNASADVAWCNDAKSRGEQTVFPIKPEFNPLAGFEPFEALSGKEQVDLCWIQHGMEISEILHGEQGALIVASQLVSSMPTVEAKLFASSQVSDEARHVEFFSRYLSEVVGRIYPPSGELKWLIEFMIHDTRWDMKFICCQLIIESLAMAKFQELRQKCLNMIMSSAIDYISKDEARHVNFGATFLKNYISSLPQSEIQYRCDFVIDNVLKLSNAQNVYQSIADQMGWNKTALRLHLRKHRIQHRDINRDRFRQLTINLKETGLLTDEGLEKIMSMNLV